MGHTWFLDRTHACRETGRQLRKAGVDVVKHRQKYTQGSLDDRIWIREVAALDWLIISGDKGLELDGINRQAVIQSGAKVFILDETESKGIDWAAALIAGRHKIEKIASNNSGPFFVTVEKNGDSHVCNLRFVGAGGPLIRLQHPDVGQMELPQQSIETPLPPQAEQVEMFDEEENDEDQRKATDVGPGKV
ncbi:MAG: hypothetical protein ACM3JB_27820 [Acidobacteriaceae bacterium]